MSAPPSQKVSAIQQLLTKHKLTEFSQIKQFLSQPPYNLTIREEGTLYCLSYDLIKSDFSIPAVQEARGLILRKDTNQIVAKGFTKFFNANEGNSALSKLDKKSLRYIDKLDGSLIKLYWDDEKQQFRFGTNNSFETKVCCVHKKSITFYELIMDAGGNQIDLNQLSREYTYLFELIHPENRVILDYHGEKKLTFLGAVHLPTLQELDDRSRQQLHIPDCIPIPKEYQFASIEDAIQHMHQSSEHIEGCVAIDANFNRVKIKTKKYITMAHLKTSQPNPLDILFIASRGEIPEFLAYYPELESQLNMWDLAFNKVLDKLWSDFSKMKSEISQEAVYKGDKLSQKELYGIIKTYDNSSFMSTLWIASQKSATFEKSDVRQLLATWKSLKSVCEKHCK